MAAPFRCAECNATAVHSDRCSGFVRDQRDALLAERNTLYEALKSLLDTLPKCRACRGAATHVASALGPESYMCWRCGSDDCEKLPNGKTVQIAVETLRRTR